MSGGEPVLRARAVRRERHAAGTQSALLHTVGTMFQGEGECRMSGAEKQSSEQEQGIDVTTTVEDHGNRLREPVRYHEEQGSDTWRQDEEGETDTPENTGSKVGPGRDDQQP